MLAAGNWHFTINKEVKHLLPNTGLVFYCLGVLPEDLSKEDCELYARSGRVLKDCFSSYPPVPGLTMFILVWPVSGCSCNIHTGQWWQDCVRAILLQSPSRQVQHKGEAHTHSIFFITQFVFSGLFRANLNTVWFSLLILSQLLKFICCFPGRSDF